MKIFNSVMALMVGALVAMTGTKAHAQRSKLQAIFAANPTVVRGVLLDGKTPSSTIRNTVEMFADGLIPLREIQGNGIWNAMSGGNGSVVGNGGGLIESYFYSSYATLALKIEQCMVSRRCDVTPEERVILGKIADIARNNVKQKFGLIFIDKNKGQDLFLRNDPSRVAMTGFEPGLPIFINLNQIYDSSGFTTFRRLDTLAILVHEVGHQAGERNHYWLDSLGSKIVSFVGENALTLKNERDYQKPLEVWIEQMTGSTHDLVAAYSYGSGMRDISAQVRSMIQCPGGYWPEPFHYTISNLHWSGSPRDPQPKIGFWAEMQCVNQQTQSIEDVVLDPSPVILIRIR